MLFFNGTSMLSNYLSKLSGWTLIVLLVCQIIYMIKIYQYKMVFIAIQIIIIENDYKYNS